MLRSAILMILLCRGLWASAETVYTVDCNGGGDFRTIQACFDALPSKPAEWRTVRIMPGTYREKVTLDVYKDKVVVVGCGKYPDDVRLVWDDYSGKVVDGRELTTYDSYTFLVQADDVLLHNLEVCNDAGRVGQAVALETRGDRIWIDGCRLIGNSSRKAMSRAYSSRTPTSRVRRISSSGPPSSSSCIAPSIARPTASLRRLRPPSATNTDMSLSIVT